MAKAVLVLEADYDRLEAEYATLYAEVEQWRQWRDRLREVQLCGVCGRTCEIVHKTVSVELLAGRIARFHSAYEGDCWDKLRDFILERYPARAPLEEARDDHPM